MPREDRARELREPPETPRQSRQLIAQHLKHQSRIQFRIVDVACLQASVMVVLDQVMVGITRKCEGIQP